MRLPLALGCAALLLFAGSRHVFWGDYFVEAWPAVQLARGWTASAALGVRRRDNGADYTAFNAGVTKAVGPLQLDVRYYDTNHSGLGVPYHARVVGSARLRF